MKKNLLGLFIVLFALIFLGFSCAKKTPSLEGEKSEKQALTQKVSKLSDLSQGEIDVCKIFPAEKVSEILGKNIDRTENLKNKDPNFVEFICSYYLGTKTIMLHVLRGNTESIWKGYEIIGWQLKEDPSVPFKHKLIYNNENKFRELHLILDKNLELTIDTWANGLTDEENINFCKKFANYLKTNF